MNKSLSPQLEITVKAVLLGVVLSVVLAAANAYLGLFAGMTVSASIPAAALSMGVLRLFRRSGILENNIVQTAASAGESLAAGVIFTMPGLVILGFWQEFDYLWVTLIAGFGGLLGVLFTIPLRRALILEEGLRFPEGVATAEVLKAAHGGQGGLGLIAAAAGAAGLLKLGESGFRLWSGVVQAARPVGTSLLYLGSNLSPALLSVGYIVGLNIAVLILAGGLANWLVAIPITAALEPWPRGADGAPISALDFGSGLWSARTRHIGVGAMLVGGLWSICRMRRSILRGVRSGLYAYRAGVGADAGTEAAPNPPAAEPARLDIHERDIPMKWILVLLAASVVPLYLVYQHFVARAAVALPMAAVMLAAGFVFSAVAAYMAGVVGSSNNPISGVTIATVAVAALLLAVLMGRAAPNGPAAAILLGSVVCCAAAIAGDNMQDLKTGHLVGATPWKQQIMQMVGTVAAAFVLAPVLTLLLKAYGFQGHASATDSALTAPQANLMASVAKGVFSGALPWAFVGIGMGLAVGIIALDELLARAGAGFRTPVLAVAIGFYLPLQLGVPIFLGGLIHHLAARRLRRRAVPVATSQHALRRGLLLACGLITGEAVVGILLAVPIVLSGKTNILALAEEPLGPWPGAVLLTAVAAWLYLSAVRLAKTDLTPAK